MVPSLFAKTFGPVWHQGFFYPPPSGSCVGARNSELSEKILKFGHFAKLSELVWQYPKSIFYVSKQLGKLRVPLENDIYTWNSCQWCSGLTRNKSKLSHVVLGITRTSLRETSTSFWCTRTQLKLFSESFCNPSHMFWNLHLCPELSENSGLLENSEFSENSELSENCARNNKQL